MAHCLWFGEMAAGDGPHWRQPVAPEVEAYCRDPAGYLPGVGWPGSAEA